MVPDEMPPAGALGYRVRRPGLLVLRMLRWAAIVMTGLLVIPFVIWIVALWLRS